MTPARPLLGLTLHRPWPVLIALGIKTVENRTWHPEPRLQPGEWFAVHAGKKYDDTATPLAVKLGVDMGIFFDQPLNTESSIVAVARYAGYTRASDNPWFSGPIAWILDRVVAISPIAAKGAQGLWTVDKEIAERCRAAFRESNTMTSAGHQQDDSK